MAHPALSPERPGTKSVRLARGGIYRRPQALTAVLIPLAATLALVTASRWPALAPQGLLPGGGLLLLLLATVATILHRPFEGSTLGVGALATATAVGFYGAAPAALVAALALLIADVLRRRIRRRAPLAGAERRRPYRSLQNAAALVLALLGGAAFAALSTPQGSSALRLLAITGAGYATVLSGLRFLEQRLRRPDAGPAWRRNVSAVLLDLAGWVVGMALVQVGLDSGRLVAAVLLAAFSLLSLEAARHALRHGVSRQRVEDLERLGRASRRIAVSTGEPGFLHVAERLLIECSNVLPFQWFQFELLARDAPYHSWWAGPERRLADGVPLPPPTPPPLPGVHRRTAWQVIEKDLETASQRFGRLRLWCDPRQLEGEEIGLLRELLPQMVASLEKALLDREAKLDPLTGLALRRVMEESLSSAHRKSCKEGTPMAVILCDLDHFKKLNDTHGHAAGDQALAATARLLARQAEGEGRLAARYGGEEFLLLLEGAGGDDALAVAEDLRRQVEALELQAESGPIRLTMSLGVAVFPELHVKRPQELLELADEALYEAKRRGRNRCLHNLGRGRFRTTAGKVLRSPQAARGETAEPPQIFA